ncbi:putative ankyrin repeat protein RF_0381 isoform X1 [Diabrotica virgifera virgifera]|uniref:Ankyrin-3-like n=1 Tax=Diabrotica virgifera virgifera TaxID=50390 RepID=A0ABM5JMQ2_DIAVI|nr:putative ankyrin repeat protein RF_0381 isoform X1 [Diabrotica virgifera virgifera]
MDSGASRLMFAVENGDYAEVTRLLDKGVDVNYIDPLGNSPLHTAVDIKNFEIAELLLKRNANVNTNVNRFGQSIPSPLYWAARRGHLGVLKLLIAYGASLETKCSNGLLPIHVAAEKGHFKIVKYFVENKLYHVDICTRTLRTPLSFAVVGGHSAIIKYLIKCNADVTKADMSNRRSPFRYGCNENREDLIETLIRKGFKLDGFYYGETPLHLFVRSGLLSEARRLIESGVMSYLEADVSGNTPIHVAVQYNQKEMLEYFFKMGISADFQTGEGYSLLHAAATFAQSQMVTFLLENGASIDGKIIFKGTTALHLASYHNHCGVIQVLLNKGADVMAVDCRGLRPLDYVYQKFIDDAALVTIHDTEYSTELLVKHMLLFCKDVEVPTPIYFPSKTSINEFKQKCQEELERMKTCLIENTTVSLYTFLQALRNKNKLLNFLRNHELKEELRNIKKYIDKYPIYSSLLPMILHGVHNGKERLLLLEKASAAMDIIVPNLILECKINILQMLNNKDLSSLIESVTV